ncbi:hypothetical protein [Actinoplanes sp. NPDC049265]|uniref:hypothetical protein n=1 Tax=Actinoplanes sp. NPDC049265 TaxID=3363902 RepID=UPI003715E171
MTGGSQAMFVVEYPCDSFCRIEVDLSGEHDRLTLGQMREKAEELHRGVHEPDQPEKPDQPEQEETPVTSRPAATVFLSAPGHGVPDRAAPERTRHRRR